MATQLLPAAPTDPAPASLQASSVSKEQDKVMDNGVEITDPPVKFCFPWMMVGGACSGWVEDKQTYPNQFQRDSDRYVIHMFEDNRFRDQSYD